MGRKRWGNTLLSHFGGQWRRAVDLLGELETDLRLGAAMSPRKTGENDEPFGFLQEKYGDFPCD